MTRKVHSVLLSIILLVLVLFTNSALGSSSGLNNIPTTDVTPENVLVFQTWGNFAENTHPQEFVGFKYGLFENIELGVDWKANDDTHAHAAYQMKYAFDIDGDRWRGVLGFADLSDNREHNGDFFPFVATSVDIDLARLHLGYAPQPHNDRFFFGIDKTFLFMDRNLQLKADAIQLNGKKDMLYSAGFLYELAPQTSTGDTTQTGLAGLLDAITKNVVLEAWVSWPTTDAEDVYTVKLDYVIKF